VAKSKRNPPSANTLRLFPNEVIKIEKKDIYNDGEFVSIDDYLIKDKSSSGNKSKKSLEDKLIDNPSKTGKSSKHDPDQNILDSILSDKIEFLAYILGEIDKQTEQREQVKDTIIKKIDQAVCYVRTKLYELDSWGMGTNRDTGGRRSKLEAELDNLMSQKRIEIREHWRDTAILRKEHREFQQQYRNAKRKAGIIAKGGNS
jgi:hypothetical protein